MIEKRSKLLVFCMIFLVISVGFISAQEQENQGFFSSVWEGIKHVTSSITGWISSIAGLSLEIQLDLRAPNLSIYVLNQSTGLPTLNWTPSNCAGYYIWYSDNVTEILQINYSNYNETTITPNVTLEGKYNTTWNDTTAPGVQKRFYAVAAYTENITTTSQEKVGKWNVTINDETNIKQTFASTPLEQNISIGNITPPNDFAWIFAVDNTANDTWLWTYSFLGSWIYKWKPI